MSNDSPNAPSLQDTLRQLPKIDKLLISPEFEPLLKSFPREEVVNQLRESLTQLRESIIESHAKNGTLPSLNGQLSPAAIASTTQAKLDSRHQAYYRRVINATGIILHTGLGRALLPPEAVQQLHEELSGYTLVEVDAQTGERNKREAYVAEILKEMTGAEAATVVNNNAAATLLILAGLARDREVVISRGQLVEIGGSFRIPDIMEESGAQLVEVGATNRTYIRDYEKALSENTGLLLEVHTSNYEIAGFARHTPLEELVALGQKHDIPVVSDLGSGCFVDVSQYGFRKEPLVTASVEAGADAVCFSGDKLLGGPQAGIIVGTKTTIDKLRAHPLFRALRVDKMTLIALEATLKLYRDPESLSSKLPTLRMISQPDSTIKTRADSFKDRLQQEKPNWKTEVVSSGAQAGSGALPAQEIPSWSVSISHPDLSSTELAQKLRDHQPVIFSRLQNDQVWLDFRTVSLEEEDHLLEALKSL